MATSEINEQFLTGYDAFATNGAAGDPAWLAALRREALEAFASLRFPTIKDEEWRFTNIAPILQTKFRAPLATPSVDADVLSRYEFGLPEITRLVFIDGRYSALQSRISPAAQSLEVGNLPDVAARVPGLERHLGRVVGASDSAFTALNTAWLHDAAVVHVPNGRAVTEPIHILFVNTGGAAAVHPRVLIVAERSSLVRVIETYVSAVEGVALTNAITEIVTAENATVEHYRLQLESESAYHVGTLRALQERDSHVRSFNLQMGSALARTNLSLSFNGEGIESWLHGLYVVHDAQHVDNHTFIDHAVPHCVSHEVYKGVLAGESRGVFSGKVLVRKDAQKTDARQTNRNLLLSHGARINTKPQLEIFADDVKCTHGATVGQLDPDAVFYLRSRGMSPDAARTLLTHGFAMEVLDEVTIDPLRDALDALVLAKLDTHEHQA